MPCSVDMMSMKFQNMKISKEEIERKNSKNQKTILILQSTTNKLNKIQTQTRTVLAHTENNENNKTDGNIYN